MSSPSTRSVPHPSVCSMDTAGAASPDVDTMHIQKEGSDSAIDPQLCVRFRQISVDDAPFAEDPACASINMDEYACAPLLSTAIDNTADALPEMEEDARAPLASMAIDNTAGGSVEMEEYTRTLLPPTIIDKPSTHWLTVFANVYFRAYPANRTGEEVKVDQLMRAYRAYKGMGDSKLQWVSEAGRICLAELSTLLCYWGREARKLAPLYVEECIFREYLSKKTYVLTTKSSRGPAGPLLRKPRGIDGTNLVVVGEALDPIDFAGYISQMAWFFEMIKIKPRHAEPLYYVSVEELMEIYTCFEGLIAHRFGNELAGFQEFLVEFSVYYRIWGDGDGVPFPGLPEQTRDHDMIDD